MRIFISYARKDAPAVATLRADVERAKQEVWCDAELTGGQAWWDAILGAIRFSEVFLIALSPDWLRSRACKSEYLYAVACGRRVLAVKVAEVCAELAPQEIANTQIIDYRARTADSAIALLTALVTMAPPPALPAVLPVPPPVPMSYLSNHREQTESPSLSFEQQHQLLFALKGELDGEEGDHRDTIVTLLHQLRKRRDIVESIGREIDTLVDGAAGATTRALPAAAGAIGGRGIGAGGATGSSIRMLRSAWARWADATTARDGDGTESPTSGSSLPIAPSVSAAWYTDPSGRSELRYWDGAQWTEHVTRGGRQFTDPPVK